MSYFSFSWKLLFILLLFFVFPLLCWWGLSLVERQIEQELEVRNQEQLNLYHNYFQKLLQEDPSFSNSLTQYTKTESAKVANRVAPILIDGYADEWFPYAEDRLVVRNSQQDSYLYLAEDERFFYGLVEVSDNSLVYRESPYSSRPSDMLRINLGSDFWLFQAIAPGKLNVLMEYGNSFKTVNSVFAIWQETQKGFNIEFRAPKSLIGNRINAVLYDLDDKNVASFNENYQGIFSFTNFTNLPLSREKTMDWLLSNHLSSERLLILNHQGQVIYSIGELFEATNNLFIKNAELILADSNDQISRLNNAFTQSILNATAAQESVNLNQLTFITRSGKVLFKDNKSVGQLVLESSALTSKLNLHWIRLIGTVLFVLIWLAVSFLLISKTRQLRQRIDRLREITEQAYEQDLGSVDLESLKIEGNDEVAQLYNSIYYFNERLEQRRDHQQKLLSRLNHELRTPLAIIGSSIDNLALSDLTGPDQSLLTSARSGLERLSLSLGRLSEANRLEQSIDSVSSDWFEIKPLLNNLLNSYQNTWPQSEFELKLCKPTIKIKGAEDLFAQMLDKVISNAVDFSDGKEAINIQLKQSSSDLIMMIKNSGPIIPQERIRSIFNLMESFRDKPQVITTESNLGLGLYIAKLIARKHKAHIIASNRKDSRGVIIKLIWKKTNYLVS